MNQSLLLSKITFYGIRVQTEQWFESYYIDKIQAVDVESPIPNVKPIKIGVL
jgi:hypothetical protein